MPLRELREPLALQVAQRISVARSARAITQDLLAERLGIATRNLQRIESGRQNLTLGTIERIAAALEVAPESLLPRIERKVFANGASGVPPSIVPVISLRAAPQFVADAGRVAVEGWCVIEERLGVPHFVARMTQPGLEPLVPDGAYALFNGSVADASARDMLLCRRERPPSAPGARRPRGARSLSRGPRAEPSDGLTLFSLVAPAVADGLGAHSEDGLHPIARFIRVLD